MSPSELITFIGALVTLAGVLTTSIVALSKLFAGQRCLLRSKMLEIYYHCKETETIRQYELENFILLYEAYKRLHGNSFIDEIHGRVMKFTVIT